MEKPIAQDAHLGQRLLLIRHSAPEVIPGVPSREWRLSEEGRRRCETLAERVRVYAPRVIVSSVEPKRVFWIGPSVRTRVSESHV